MTKQNGKNMKTVFIVLFTISLAGCATIGRDVNDANRCRIEFKYGTECFATKGETQCMQEMNDICGKQ